MTWRRAIATGFLVAIVSFLLLVVVPDRLLGLSSLGRSGRVFLATTEFVVALAGLLWTLRRMQARRLL